MGGAPCIAQCAIQREGLLGPQSRGRRISAVACHVSRSGQRLGAGRRRALIALERALEPTATLRNMVLAAPELRHRACKPHGELSLSRNLEPVESSTEVVDLALQPVEPLF